MSTSQAAVGPRPGLATALDIVIAPSQAFERLRIAPTWGWAYLIAAGLGIVGMFLMIPASLHGLEVGGPAMFATSPAIANLPPDQQQAGIARMIGITQGITRFQWILVPIIMLIGSLIGSVVMLIGNTIAHGDGTFKKLWALSINSAVVSIGIGLLLTGLICVVRGPASFSSPNEVQRALPSLALLAPGGGVKLQTFLAGFSIVSLWAATLLALGMKTVARMSAPAAWATSIIMLVGAAGIGAALAR